MDMERRFRQLQRATVARSALDVIALIFLGCGFAFWGVAFWQLLTPPQLLSLLTIQTVVLALVYSLAAPLLLSMLVPTTPAGQLLQKTQWRTIGFPVIIGCALFLAYQAEYMIQLWLSAQPGVMEGHFAGPLAISLTIAFVVIPALAWVQLTPERWLSQIQQAHQVKKLEMQQRGELAIIRAALIKGEQRALVGFVNLLPLEKEEHFATIRGLVMGINDQQHAIARMMGVSADLERTMMGDSDIASTLDSVKLALEDSEMRIVDAPAAPAEITRMRDLPPDQVRAAVAQAFDQATAPASPPRPAPPQSAAVSGSQRRYAAEYEAMFKRANGGVWGVGDLAVVIGKSDRSARERITAWMEQGLVARSTDGRNVYYFTEREVR